MSSKSVEESVNECLTSIASDVLLAAAAKTRTPEEGANMVRIGTK